MAAIVMSVAKHGGKKSGGATAGDHHDADPAKAVLLHDDPTRQKEDPATFAQRLVRQWLYRNKRLHRANLAERLNFESATSLGLLRFVNQLMVFALFVAALSFSSNQEATRGIRTTLDAEFDFESISDVARRIDFVQESMVGLSEKSKDFFILSNKYFDDQGVGSTQLIKDITSFSGPALSAPIGLQALEFSFTTWVKVVPQYTDGYIVRKRLVTEGSAASLACWGWYLSATTGPEFHYGCHDFFESNSANRQVHVGLESPTQQAAETFYMLTLVVAQKEVHFYRNTDYLGAAALPRPVTDCFNDGEGLLVGTAGMDLSLLRFHPRALTLSSVEELYQGGSLLADISTGSQPADAVPEGLQGVLTSSIEEVKDAVAERQAASEVTMVLKTVTEEQANPALAAAAAAMAPADAPLGNIPVASNTTMDPLNGKPYYSLAYGPWRLSPTVADADHRSLVSLPDGSGKGFTYTWWYRHMPCDKSTCGVFLFSLRDSERICLEVWLETNAIWWNNVLAEQFGNPTAQYPNNFVDDRFELNDDFNWRHMAFVWDETTDEVKFYLDGILAASGPWGSPVTGAQCTASGQYMTFGRYGPLDYTYGADVDIYDFRQYMHENGPMTDAEILKLATADTPELSPQLKCLPIDDPAMADSGWRDTFGHDCEWFFNNKGDFPALCELAATSSECPVSCASRQQCVTKEEPPPVFLTWDRIRRVQSVGSNGTICLSSSIDPEQVRTECEAWAAQHIRDHGDLSQVAEDFKAWADSMNVARSGRRVNLTSCEELMASIDPECSFDDQAVKDFTAASQANGGGSNPPNFQTAIGLWANPFGEVRVFSECDRSERDIYDNIETSASDDEGWTLITISRHNSNDALNKTGDCSTVTNIALNREGSQLTQCLYDPLMFMNAIEVNYPSLISPIMMIPKALALAEVQQSYFESADVIRVRSGPIVSNSARISESSIEIDKRDYSPRSVLMAPPIIFQTKTEPADDCPFTYSTTLIQDEHNKMAALKCNTPFACAEELLKDKFQIYACPGERLSRAEQRVFGLEPKDFNGNKGYADFLYSIVDHPILSRDGQLRYTEDFIDSRTEMAQVILVFFTPDAGTTSVMTVTADFSGYSATIVDVTLQHYEILEGDDKWIYLALQVLVMVNLTLMAIDIFANFKTMAMEFKKSRQLPTATAVVKQLIDFGTIGMCVAFIVLRIPQKFDTAPETERIVGGLSRIPWDSTDIPLDTKTSDFFQLATDLLNLIAYEQNLNRFCNIILLVSLLRVVQCTSLHPRLALLTGTVAKSFDDMWHSCILVVLLMGCFAGVASWRFGGYRDDFGNFEESMRKQFEMLFGEFPDDWTESYDMIAYTVLYIVIMFLLIQNFLLAIIVEAYMKVREHNEKMKTHQEVVADVYGCIGAYSSAWLHGWPTPGRMGRIIREWEAKNSVGFKEIYGTGEFKSQTAVVKWIQFYHRFDFLEPEEIGRFGIERPDEALEDKIEARVARVMGKELPLVEHALQIIANSNLGQKPGYEKISQSTRNLNAAAGVAPAAKTPAKIPAKPAAPPPSNAVKPVAARDVPLEVRPQVIEQPRGGSPKMAEKDPGLKDQNGASGVGAGSQGYVRADLGMPQNQPKTDYVQGLETKVLALEAMNARLQVQMMRQEQAQHSSPAASGIGNGNGNGNGASHSSNRQVMSRFRS